MSARDEFLAEMLPRQIAGERALHDGDATPRMDTWSHEDPVTLFGALGMFNSGWDEVSQTNRHVASLFSNCAAYDFELLAADVSGDLAYTVGYERHSTSIGGGPVQPHRLRVTHVYRRENGKWKIVHRHGDELTDQAAPNRPLVEGRCQPR